jgi:hypothetical protein
MIANIQKTSAEITGIKYKFEIQALKGIENSIILAKKTIIINGKKRLTIIKATYRLSDIHSA